MSVTIRSAMPLRNSPPRRNFRIHHGDSSFRFLPFSSQIESQLLSVTNSKGFSWFLILELSLHRYRCTAFLLARLCQSSRDDNRSNDRVWSKISHDGSRGRSETDSRSGLGEDDLQFTVETNIFPSFVARTPSLRAKSCKTSFFLLPSAG